MRCSPRWFVAGRTFCRGRCSLAAWRGVPLASDCMRRKMLGALLPCLPTCLPTSCASAAGASPSSMLLTTRTARVWSRCTGMCRGCELECVACLRLAPVCTDRCTHASARQTRQGIYFSSGLPERYRLLLQRRHQTCALRPPSLLSCLTRARLTFAWSCDTPRFSAARCLTPLKPLILLLLCRARRSLFRYVFLRSSTVDRRIQAMRRHS